MKPRLDVYIAVITNSLMVYTVDCPPSTITPFLKKYFIFHLYKMLWRKSEFVVIQSCQLFLVVINYSALLLTLMTPSVETMFIQSNLALRRHERHPGSSLKHMLMLRLSMTTRNNLDQVSLRLDDFQYHLSL